MRFTANVFLDCFTAVEMTLRWTVGNSGKAVNHVSKIDDHMERAARTQSVSADFTRP